MVAPTIQNLKSKIQNGENNETYTTRTTLPPGRLAGQSAGGDGVSGGLFVAGDRHDA